MQEFNTRVKTNSTYSMKIKVVSEEAINNLVSYSTGIEMTVTISEFTTLD